MARHINDKGMIMWHDYKSDDGDTEPPKGISSVFHVNMIFRYQATYTRGARQGGWQKIDPVPPNLDLLRSRTQ